MELSDHHIHNLNDAFGPDRLETLPVSADGLYDRINQTADNPFYRGSGGRTNLVNNLKRTFKDIDTYGERGVDHLAKLVGYAAWDTGGVDILGRHWCADHGHRATAPVAATLPKQVRVAASASVRTVFGMSDFEWTVTLHQPCCPQTLSGKIETATLIPNAAVAWAQQLADKHTGGDPHLDWEESDGKGVSTVCCCLTDGVRPVDVIYLDSDALAERYWKLLRAMRFEVRIADPGHGSYTYDEDDPVPGHDTAEIWRLSDNHGTVSLEVGSYEECLDDAEADLTGELTQLIGLLRR